MRKKIKKLSKKRDENNIENIIDLLCYTIEEYRQKTKYSLLKEYGDLCGVNIEDYGYYFTYDMSNKKFKQIMSIIESKLSVDNALVVGKIKKIEYKIGYMRQQQTAESIA